jgi:hypothetical protein
MTNRTITLFLVLVTAAHVHAQTGNNAEDSESATLRMPFEQGFNPAEGSSNAVYWQNVVDSDAGNEAAWFNLMLANKQQGNATFYLQNNAAVNLMADSIIAIAPNTFEAHYARYLTKYPSNQAFEALDLANTVAPGRPELIGANLEAALVRDNTGLARQQAMSLFESGRIAPTLNTVADDLSLDLEDNAIIVCEGEMDCYPLYARQAGIGKPDEDALIIDRQLLQNSDYGRAVWNETIGAGNPPTGPNGIIKGICQRSNRPVYLAMSLDRSLLNDLQSNLYVVGNVFRYSNTPINNIPVLENNWKRLNGIDQAGSLNGNYLLPAIVLKNHYEENGQNSKALKMQGEIEKIAERNGKKQQLINSGILPE